MDNFLPEPELTDAAARLYDEDLADNGYVMNLSRLWAYQPDTLAGLFELVGGVAEGGGLTPRQRAVLVAACASTLGDSYCSLAWGARLAKAAGEEAAAGVLRGDDSGLEAAERVMAAWARKVARDPNGTGPADVRELRAAGFDDRQVFAMTAFVALRLAFSTVNDALGALPDAELRAAAPPLVRAAVTYGRPPATTA
ncbi:hypothetical protein MF672_050460 [Actinomadura sp. ATCC 31491]|uniref:Carboxymuconolactone decarboxylase family protein n=1 Tax=Actinomadura luzonensis TaxID=2805427 RepID=A0ABT0GBJ1_9ACTN|nr:hypothetical protein [Actinomadura luzonensis]MCK2221981.1 hypothetical protein [Actinomadura luzonensis]